MKIIEEFKSFALKGSLIDMATGIIIGAGFGKIVSSLVNDIIMPPIGLLVGGVDFKELKLILKEANGQLPAVSLNYGSFIQVIFDFLIIALCIFFVIKIFNKALKTEKKDAPTAEVIPSKEELLLTEIRDILKNK